MEYIETYGATNSTVIMFHGYGADMNDLQGLSTAIPGGENFRWIFPNGIKPVEIGPQYFGRAWFNIDLEEFDRAMREGRSRDLSKLRPPGMDAAILAAEEFIKQLNIPEHELIIGGFSQGAMLATELVARREKNIKGAILLSAILVDEAGLKPLAKRHSGQRFFQSHGTHDQLLGFDQAQRLEKLLKDCGWDGELNAFRGGHEIPYSILQSLGYFMRSLLPDET